MDSPCQPRTPTTQSTRPNSIIKFCGARRSERRCKAAKAWMCREASRGWTFRHSTTFSTHAKLATMYVRPMASQAKTASIPRVSSATSGRESIAGNVSGRERTPKTSKQATEMRKPRRCEMGSSAEARRCSTARSTAANCVSCCEGPTSSGGKEQMNWDNWAKSMSRGNRGGPEAALEERARREGLNVIASRPGDKRSELRRNSKPPGTCSRKASRRKRPVLTSSSGTGTPWASFAAASRPESATRKSSAQASCQGAPPARPGPQGSKRL
mmetsp:Transcript_122904/g.274533  ORF Transcript_122904/g.274533 Transcript_122904/m.274533 type:complete len:270 (+) Transcript_122904:599-1408(+)